MGSPAATASSSCAVDGERRAVGGREAYRIPVALQPVVLHEPFVCLASRVGGHRHAGVVHAPWANSRVVDGHLWIALGGGEERTDVGHIVELSAARDRAPVSVDGVERVVVARLRRRSYL
jgi:hypothetical protein